MTTREERAAAILRRATVGTIRDRAAHYTEATDLGRIGEWVTDQPVGRLITLRSTKTNDSWTGLNFRSRNYLGLSHDPVFRERMASACMTYGGSAATSPYNSGRTVLQKALETTLAEFLGVEDVVLMASGFMANLGAISALGMAGARTLVDSKSHRSLLDGVGNLRGPRTGYDAAVANDLTEAIGDLPKDEELVITGEAVAPVTCSVFPLEEALRTMRERENAYLLLDECHSFGVLGPHGRGLYATVPKEVRESVKSRVILTGTFSKAVPVIGGFVASTRELCCLIRNASQLYNYSASTMTPADLAGASYGIEFLRAGAEEVGVAKRAASVADLFASRGARSAGGIVSIPIGRLRCEDVEDALRAKGVLASALGFPAVAEGAECVRLIISLSQTDDDVARVCESVASLLAERPA